MDFTLKTVKNLRIKKIKRVFSAFSDGFRKVFPKTRLLLFLAAGLTTGQLLADSHPGYPPNPLDTAGGKRAPAFSDANQQAIYWINLSDAAAYGATWLGAGSLLKDTVSQEQWTAAMVKTRTALGPAHSRKVESHNFAQTLPYGTRGNFVIINYDTSFERMPGAVETIILMTEGQLAEWKVISYRIKNR